MSELDRYLDRLGDQLAGARPRRSRRPLVALPALAAIAVAIVAATLVFGPGGQQRPVNALAAARAALETNGEILHIKVRIALDPSVKIAPGATIAETNEQWSQSDPKRWRFRETRTNGSWAEFAYADGTSTDYTSDTNRRRDISGYRDTDPQARSFGIYGLGRGKDPDADLKTMLATGKVKDVGVLQAHGRTVRRLTGGDELRAWVYDVDPDTFAPVSIAMTLYRPGGISEGTTHLFIEVYEWLPLGSDVFTVQSKPDAKVTSLTKQEFLQQIKDQRRRLRVWSRCVKRNHGSHKGCGPSPYLAWR